MDESAGDGRQLTALTIGALLIGAAGVMFALIFLALYPVVRNPVGTYDRWFPTTEAEEVTQVTVPGPQAAFDWETLGTLDGDTPTVRFSDASVQVGAPITTRVWEFGDGSTATGEVVDHQFANPGNYTARLTVTAANGESDAVQGRVAVRSLTPTFGAAGSIDELLDFGSFDSTFGDFGDALSAPIGDVVDSVGNTARGGVVVALFALAALGALMVAWRVGRIGAMLVLGVEALPRRRLLRQPEHDQLRLVSSDD